MLSFVLFLFVLVSNNLFLTTSPILPYLREESSSSFDVVMLLLRDANEKRRRDQKQLLSALLRETRRVMLVKKDPLAKAANVHTTLKSPKNTQL